MSKYDKDYVEGFKDAKYALLLIDSLLKSVYAKGNQWKNEYQWETANNKEMQRVAVNMERLVARADQSRAVVNNGLLRVDRLLKEAEGDKGK